MRIAGFISMHTHDRNEDKAILNNIKVTQPNITIFIIKQYEISLVLHTSQAWLRPIGSKHATIL
jgi:hypothetical protein